MPGCCLLEREPFGFKDGISQPAVEGSPIPGSNRLERALKAGEFVLGYPDETRVLAATPQPEVLGRNGTYVVFRKLHQRVAAFRQYLRANAASPEEQTLLSAKIMGRWPSGAPLVLSPDQDDPALGAGSSPQWNEFLYHVDDPKGFQCPVPPARALSAKVIDERAPDRHSALLCAIRASVDGASLVG